MAGKGSADAGGATRRLVIVESPAKAKTIKGYLGPGYTVEASVGHIRDLPAGADEVPEKYKGTPIGRLVTMAEVVDAARFLLENRAMNGINLPVDGGWLCM